MEKRTEIIHVKLNEDGIKEMLDDLEKRNVPECVQKKAEKCIRKILRKKRKVSQKKHDFIYFKQLYIVSDTKQILGMGPMKGFFAKIDFVFQFIGLEIGVECRNWSPLEEDGKKSWNKKIFLIKGLQKTADFLGMTPEDVMKAFNKKAGVKEL